MSTKIFEEDRAPVATDAKRTFEKQARQLAYDTRYQVKKETGGKKVDPNAMRSLLLRRLQKSTAPSEVKIRAKQMLLGENHISDVRDFASDNVARALYKVFVEGVNNEVVLDYLEELKDSPDKKYKVYVYDPKTKNSYHRFATREKITQLRTKGLKVELTEYGETREDEAKRGVQTANALGGGNKSKKDYDGDGKIESGAKEYRGAIHNAIQRKKGLPADGKDTSNVKEEYFSDSITQKARKITGSNVDNSKIVKVFPEDGSDIQPNVAKPRNVYAHTEVEGELIAEKAMSKAQQRFMGMVYARKKGEMKKGEASPEVEAAAKGMTKKEAKKFAKTKHKGLPGHVKEAAGCGSDDKENERDPRGDYAKINMVKNKLRAMGAKNPIVMINSEETVEEGRALGKAGSESDDNPKGAAVRASSGRGMTMTPARGLGASKPEGSDEERRKKHADQVRSDRRAAARERSEAGEDRLGRLIRSVQKDNYQPDGDQLDELNRLEKEQGKESGGSSDEAYRSVKRTIRGMEGKPEGQRKKVPGKKPPVAGEYGGPRSPAQKVAARRASAQRAQDMYKPRAGESD